MKKVKLNEESYKRLIREISYNKVDMASKMSDNTFWQVNTTFDEFYDALKYETDVDNPYIKKIREYADAIADILIKKEKQHSNFDNELSKFDYKKFYADENRPEDEEDYDDLDLRYLQNKYPKD